MNTSTRQNEDAALPKRSRAAMREAYATLFRKNYIAFQYHFVEFMTGHLIRCSRRFGGDLDEMLILAIIGQVHLRAELDIAADGRVSRRSEPSEVSISASRIADVTGIPRATARRKLAKLQKRGWVEQLSDGQWKLIFRDGAAPVAHELTELDASGIDGMADLMAALQPIADG
jgi:DNA-binding MarR family transcriptional regulator